MPNRIEKAAATVMGTAKAVKATLTNLHGVFKELEREHGEVTALLLRLKKSSDPGLRRSLFPAIREALLSHEKGELAAVYPKFREHEELVAFADVHDREAGALERTIKRLSELAYEDSAWQSTFLELVDMVSSHVREEENDFFPTANRILGKEAAEQMQVGFLRAKHDAMREPLH